MFKTLAIVAASIALTAGAASAGNTFGLLTSVEQGDNYYDISTISTLGEGFVQIETFAGDILGSTDLNVGANTNTRVQLDNSVSTQNLVAKLIVDGEVVDENRIRVRR